MYRLFSFVLQWLPLKDYMLTDTFLYKSTYDIKKRFLESIDSDNSDF